MEDRIRELAYEKWEKAGRPPGDGVNFWCEAEAELKEAVCTKDHYHTPECGGKRSKEGAAATKVTAPQKIAAKTSKGNR